MSKNKIPAEKEIESESNKKTKNKKWLKWPVIAVAVVLLIVGGYFGWSYYKSTQVKVVNLPSFTVEQTDLSEKISLTGIVKTVFLTEVITKADGIVSKVYVENGDQVKAGDKLFELSLTPASKQKAQSTYNALLNAKNNLSSAQAQLYTNQYSLFQTNQNFVNGVIAENVDKGTPDYIMPQAQWLAAEANYKTQEDKVKTSQQAVTVASLDYQQYQSTVLAPTAGEVQGIAVTEGMMTTYTDDASQRLAVIKTGSTLLVQLDVSEMDISKVKTGQNATITIAAIGNQTYEGKVISIDKIGSNSNGVATYPVLISFVADESVDILPNMSVDVDLKVSEQLGVTTISTLAVQKENGKNFVDLITSETGSGKNKKMVTEKRYIEIGTQTDSNTEVKSGLQVGDKVQMADFNEMLNSGVKMQGSGVMMMGGTGGPAGGGMRQISN